MPLVVYLDETGDHSLAKIDPGYPIFGVVMLVCDSDVYCRDITPSMYQFKLSIATSTKSFNLPIQPPLRRVFGVAGGLRLVPHSLAQPLDVGALHLHPGVYAADYRF